MSSIFKFPNGGFDVEVCRKQDIMDCIDADANEKEVILAIVTQCEADANTFLSEGRWTGIPYLGNMRLPEYKRKFYDINGVELLETAKETLDEQRYKVFKRNLNANIACDIKRERLYRYMTSQFVTKHRTTYSRFVKYAKVLNFSNPNGFARFMCYSLIDLSSCSEIY